MKCQMSGNKQWEDFMQLCEDKENVIWVQCKEE